MDLTCEGKSLGGFQLGVMKSSFFFKKKQTKNSLPALWGLDCSQAQRMQGYQAEGQEMLGSGQGEGTEIMRSGEMRSVF